MVCFKIFVGLLLFNEVIVHIVEKVDWGLDIRKCVNISLRLAAGGVTVSLMYTQLTFTLRYCNALF